jgi:ribosomal protein L37AE/L43A
MDLTDILSGETKRGNCPKCHRYNTFTLSRTGNTIKWNCYSASCNYSGVKNNTSMSLEDIKFNHQQKNKTKGKQNVIDVSRLAYSNICSDFLDKYCINNINIPVLYDPLERRVAFMIQHKGENIDAIGRALDVWRRPKWKRYSDIDTSITIPFDAPPKSNLIIVEDIISAWKAVTYLDDTDAMPLLGTSLSTNNLNKIWDTYNSVTIALDKDATDKAINMSRRIFVGVDKCKVVALELDIKDMAIEDIQKCLS